jgi:hypothetical protein
MVHYHFKWNSNVDSQGHHVILNVNVTKVAYFSEVSHHTFFSSVLSGISTKSGY